MQCAIGRDADVNDGTSQRRIRTETEIAIQLYRSSEMANGRKMRGMDVDVAVRRGSRRSEVGEPGKGRSGHSFPRDIRKPLDFRG